MKTRGFILLILLVMATTLACTISVPSIEAVKTSETQTFEIDEPGPESVSDPADLTIKMGAGKLNIEGGSDSWVEGSIRYNVPDWEPDIERDGASLTIDQAVRMRNTFPAQDIINEWDIFLSDEIPMDLRIEAGAYEGVIDLSGVPLTGLTINDGASQAEVIFNQPNPETMQELVYKTGASDVTLTGLANANFEDMTFSGGAGSYTLDFSGEMQRDGYVRITGGVSNVKIIVPEDTHAVLEITGGLSNVNTRGTWTMSGSRYETGGSGPTLTIEIEIGAGNLELEQE